MSSYHIFARYYDLLSREIEYTAIADYHVGLLSLYGENVRTMADVACGTGSLTCLYAQKGFHVIGLDNSEDMLMQAAQKTYADRRPAAFVQQSMEDFVLPAPRDAVLCSFDSVNHLSSVEGLASFFRQTGRALKPDGLLIFDMNTLYKHREILGNNTFVYDMEDVYLVWQNSFSESTKRVLLELDFFIKQSENGLFERYSESFRESYFSPKQIEKALTDNGFAIRAVYDDFTMNPPHKESQRLTYVAVRQ